LGSVEAGEATKYVDIFFLRRMNSSTDVFVLIVV
jgi:hypothetical protein